MSCLHKVWLWLREWWPYGVYELSNFLLIIFGIWLSFEGFAKKVEANKIYKRSLAAICFLLSGVGMYFDAVARHDGDKSSRQLIEKVGSSLDKTNELLTKTNALLTRTDTLAKFTSQEESQLAEIQTKSADIDKRLYAAREKHDPQMVHDLETKAQEAHQQADRISKELLALTMAPHVAEQLRNWQDDYNAEKRDLGLREYENEIVVSQGPMSNEERGRKIDAVRKQSQSDKDRLDQEYEDKLKGLFVTADFVRRELLQWIPLQQINRFDKEKEQQFALTLKQPTAMPQKEAADYLEDLAKRVPPPK